MSTSAASWELVQVVSGGSRCHSPDHLRSPGLGSSHTHNLTLLLMVDGGDGRDEGGGDGCGSGGDGAGGGGGGGGVEAGEEEAGMRVQCCRETGPECWISDLVRQQRTSHCYVVSVTM